MRKPSRAVLQALAVTAEVCGAELSEAAATVMLADLAEYPEQAVLTALQRVRREHKGRLVLAAIIERIDDGRPGVEVAWAMVPRDERDTAVLTLEMAEALRTAAPLLSEGDEIAARMAFKEAYVAAVSRERAAGVPVQWQASIGWDQRGRVAPLADAVKLGRITVAQAQHHVGDEHLPDMLALAGVTDHPALAAPRALPAPVAEFVAAKTKASPEPAPPPESTAERAARIDAEKARIRRIVARAGITEDDMRNAAAVVKESSDAA